MFHGPRPDENRNGFRSGAARRGLDILTRTEIGPEHAVRIKPLLAGDINHRPGVLFVISTNLRTPAPYLVLIDSYDLESTDSIQNFISLPARLFFEPSA